MDISNIEIAEEFYRIINDDLYYNNNYKSYQARYAVGFIKDIIANLINGLNKHDAVNEILKILRNPETIFPHANQENIRLYNGSIVYLKKLLILKKLYHLYNAYNSEKLTSDDLSSSLISRFITENGIEDVNQFPTKFYTYYEIIQREKIFNDTTVNKSEFEKQQKNLVTQILNNRNIATIIYEQEIRTDSSISLNNEIIKDIHIIEKLIELLKRLSESYINSLTILSPKNKYILKKCKHIIEKEPNIETVSTIQKLKGLVSATDEKILYLGLNLLQENYEIFNTAISSGNSSIYQAYAGGFNNRKTKRVLKRY